MNEKKIKELRKKLNISQKKLAEMLGVHLRTVQNWENGGKIPQSKEAFIRNIAYYDNAPKEHNQSIIGNNNTQTGTNNNISARQRDESFEIARLCVLIEEKDKLLAEKEDRIREQDIQIKEKDIQIGKLLSILSK
jgi:transcriptional regulator with XRE-family HTH domain